MKKIGICENPHCGGKFVDKTMNHSQKYCNRKCLTMGDYLKVQAQKEYRELMEQMHNTFMGIGYADVMI